MDTVSPETGKFRCITDGLGRASGITFRTGGPDLRPDAERDDHEDRRWLRNELVLRATDNNTYATGIYTDAIEGTQKPRKVVMLDCAIGATTRPRDADRLFVTYSRFEQYPDVWTTDLAFGGGKQLTDACAFQSGHMNKNVLGAMLRSDKAETFGGVEPFHGAFGHRDVSYFGRHPRIAMTWLSVVRVATEARRRQKVERRSFACPKCL